jgi:hypothetical protein
LDGGVAVGLRSQRIVLDVGMAGSAVGLSASCFFFFVAWTLSARNGAFEYWLNDGIAVIPATMQSESEAIEIRDACRAYLVKTCFEPVEPSGLELPAPMMS